MLDTRIATFLTVCKFMNYTKAAEVLHITQPAVSQHIHFLEEHYGQKLFQYQDRKLTLTKAGQILHDTMSVIQNDEDAVIQRMKDTQVKDISFGVSLTSGEYALTDSLATYMKKHPNTNFHVIYGNTSSLLEQLEQGEISFALMDGNYPTHKYEQIPFHTEQFICVAHHNHVFSKPIMQISDLLSEHIIVRENGAGLRTLFNHFLFTSHVSIKDFLHLSEIANIHTILELLKADVGITFLYRISVQHLFEEGIVKEIPLQNLPILNHSSFIWNQNSVYAKEYRSICQELVNYHSSITL